MRTEAVSGQGQGGLRAPLPERYLVVRQIGAGGMATIWAAEDSLLRREVAVKVLAEHLAAQPRFVERFQREARTAAGLSSHPHLITIYDVGEHEGRPFIVMEYLSGGTVAERLRDRGRPAPGEALRWLRETASALDFAHERGVVHRDVKPQNLLFDEQGRVVVGDLGIARAAYEERLTASGELLGTAAYISPEQAQGDAGSPASDRYSLALVAFELLTGAPPFAGGTFAEQALRQVEARPPRASDVAPDLPAEADDALERGLSKDPPDRWPTAMALVEALEGAFEHPRDAAPALAPAPAVRDNGRHETATGQLGPDSGEPAVVWSSRRRSMVPAWIAAAALALAALGVVWAAGLLDGGEDGGRGNRAATRDTGAERDAGGGRSNNAARRSDRGSSSSGSSADDQQAPSSGGADAAPTPAQPGPAQLNDRGYRLMNGGRYEEAIPILLQAVRGFPADSRDLTYAYALYNLGRSLRLAGRPAEAIPYLERRLEFDNQRPTVERELAAARRAAG